MHVATKVFVALVLITTLLVGWLAAQVLAMREAWSRRLHVLEHGSNATAVAAKWKELMVDLRSNPSANLTTVTQAGGGSIQIQQAADELMQGDPAVSARQVQDLTSAFLERKVDAKQLMTDGFGVRQLQNLLTRLRERQSEELTDQRIALAKAEQELVQWQDLLADAKVEMQRLEEEAKQAIANHGLRTKELKDRQVELAKLEQETDRERSQREALDDQWHELEQKLARTMVDNARLATELEVLQDTLDAKVGERGTVVTSDGKPLEGKVVVVSKSDHRVTIDFGTRRGLRVGNRLHVYRRTKPGNPRFVGSVEVTSADADRAVAEVLPPYRQSVFQVGDSVSSDVAPESLNQVDQAAQPTPKR